MVKPTTWTPELEDMTLEKNFSTKNRGPWKLIFPREFKNRNEAMEFENYLKSLKNREYILEKISM